MSSRRVLWAVALVAVAAFVYLSRPLPLPPGGFIDKTGRMVISPRFQRAGPFSEGLTAVAVDGKWGYIDKSGRMVIKPQFEQADNFSEGMAAVGRGNSTDGGPKFGYINKHGKLVIPYKFDGAEEFHNGLAQIFFNDNGGFVPGGYIDKTGKIMANKLTENETFSEGLTIVKDPKTEKYGYADKNGKIVIRQQYLDARFFNEGLAAASYDRFEWGFIDKTGKWIVQPKYRQVSYFFDDMARVCVEYKWGFVNKKGQMVIPPKFTYVKDFHDGLVAVVSWEDNQVKSGYLDKTGRIVIPIRFYNRYINEVSDFSEGLAFVRTKPVPWCDMPGPCDHTPFHLGERIGRFMWRVHDRFVD